MALLAHRKWTLLFTAIIALGFFGVGFSSNAATVSLIPSSASVDLGGIFTVRALVNTQGKSINNAEAVINFPSDLVEVVSVSGRSSIFSLWVEQPSFSNTSGNVVFNGGVVNPGFNGAGGEALSIVFKAKKAGIANIVLSDVAVRENDGLGTNVLTGQYPTAVTIRSISSPPPSLPPVEEETGDVGTKLGSGTAPIIISSTCPDQEKWCSAESVLFNWDLPSGAIAVQTLIGKKSDSIPSVYYDSAINKKEVSDLSDGTWYFHVRYQDSTGWSQTGHYKVNIDRTPPTTDLGIDQAGQENGLKISSADELSGISRYEISVDGKRAFDFSASELKQPTLLPALAFGDHNATVVTYDGAGNAFSKDISFSTQSLVAPTLTIVSDRITTKDSFVLSGTSSYPQSPVRVVAVHEIGTTYEYTTETDGKGNYTLKGKPLPSGVYAITARIIALDGSMSPESNRVIFVVDGSYGISIGSINIRFSPLLGVAVLAVILLIVSTIMLVRRRRTMLKRGHILIEKIAHHSFDLLVERARHQMKMLEYIKKKRGTNEEFNRVMDELNETLDKIDEVVKSKPTK